MVIGPHSNWLRGGVGVMGLLPCLSLSLSLSEPIDLVEATMSHARPMYPQQLPTAISVTWLIVTVVFVMFVVVPGALGLLGLLISNSRTCRVDCLQ